VVVGSNEQFNLLFVAILPIIHLGPTQWGLTEQTITLVPQKEFATEFFSDEVNDYLLIIKNRADKYLTGGHVKRYEFDTEITDDQRVVIMVRQYVAG
jgi:hypothetical protein